MDNHLQRDDRELEHEVAELHQATGLVAHLVDDDAEEYGDEDRLQDVLPLERVDQVLGHDAEEQLCQRGIIAHAHLAIRDVNTLLNIRQVASKQEQRQAEAEQRRQHLHED